VEEVRPNRAAELVQVELVDQAVVDEDTNAKPPAQRPSWTLDASGKDLNQKLLNIKDDIGYWVQKGRFNKVRVSKDGKKVLPDIPVGALLAAEVATLAWAGALRTAIVNVAGRLLFKVELINDAQEHLTAAKGHYAKGDLDEAEAEAVRCVKVDGRLPEAFLLLGTLAKVRGNRDEALRHFRKARDLDPHGDIGRQAETAGRRLDPDFSAPSTTPEKS